MVLLSKVADEILDKYGNVSSNLVNSTKDYFMVSMIGVMTISQATKLFTGVAKRFKPDLNPR